MDIVVADESPLGRYLAELDGEAGVGSLADLLQNELRSSSASDVSAASKERLSRSSAAAASAMSKRRRRPSIVSWLHVMRIHAKRFVAHWFIGNLTSMDEEALRDELNELSTCEQCVRRWWWLCSRCDSSPDASFANFKSPDISIGATLLLPACAIVSLSSSSVAASYGRVIWHAIALVVAGVLVIELVYQLTLLLHWRKARQVIAAIRSYSDAREAFELSYQQSLDLVKKAELASRGYRIGPMLPPVGRIEKVTSMKCTQLRLRLRQINDDMKAASVKLKNRESVADSVDTGAAEGQKDRKKRVACGVEQDNSVDSQRAPSLLISALIKRHELANVVLEEALHALLFDVVSLYWDLPSDGEDKEDLQENVNRQRESRVVAFEYLLLQYKALATMLSAWKRELDQMNNSRSMRFLHSMGVKNNNSVSDTTGGGDSSNQEKRAGEEKDEGFEVVSERLKELRTACETLKHLVFAAQHDVATGVQSPSSQQLSQSLADTRGLMKNMVQSLNDAWTQYETALDALGGAEAPLTRDNSVDLDVEEMTAGDHDAGAAEARQRESEEARFRKNQERKKFTFVFTGTSTGEKDFDLKAILKEQQQQKALPVPRFVRELQDVLAHRKTHSQPTITKQIDHDKPITVATENPPELSAESRSSSLEKLPSSSSLSLPGVGGGGSLQSELQSLLLLQRVRAASEEFFD